MNHYYEMEHTETLIEQFERAKIDYSVEYMKLYIVYNRWYRLVTGEVNDRAAIQKLKKRYVIWFDYSQHKTLTALYGIMTQLVELTQRENDWQATHHWQGYIQNNDDWRSLIEFWYVVRCKVVHGSQVKHEYIQLAYASLCLFLDEIINRIKTMSPHNYFDNWGVDMHPVPMWDFVS